LNTGRHTSWAAHGVGAEAHRPPEAASRKPPMAGSIVAEQISMPITQFLGNSKFDPETTRLMGIAFEMARAALRAPHRVHLTDEAIAARIIEFAKSGERNVDVLCEAALNVTPRVASSSWKKDDAT
jgi:hypothetical protein